METCFELLLFLPIVISGLTAIIGLIVRCFHRNGANDVELVIPEVNIQDSNDITLDRQASYTTINVVSHHHINPSDECKDKLD